MIRNLVLVLFLLVGTKTINSKENEFGYPISNATGKIAFEKIIPVPGTQRNLFKYGLQFVANQNFNREVVIKTKAKKLYYNSVVVPHPVTYQDEEQGKIFGNGFFDFEYRSNNRFVITFSYKIYVKDNEYRYVFTDFIVKEFVDAGKSIGRDHISSTSSHNSDARILSFPLEEFIERPRYKDSDPIFYNQMAELRKQLKTAMKGEL